jgi:hypothetical protein
MGHVSAPEPVSEAEVVQTRWTHVSAEALLGGEAGSGVGGRVAAPDLSWTVSGVQSLWTRGSARALLGGGAGSGALDTWQRRSPP